MSMKLLICCMEKTCTCHEDHVGMASTCRLSSTPPELMTCTSYSSRHRRSAHTSRHALRWQGDIRKHGWHGGASSQVRVHRGEGEFRSSRETSVVHVTFPTGVQRARKASPSCCAVCGGCACASIPATFARSACAPRIGILTCCHA